VHTHPLTPQSATTTSTGPNADPDSSDTRKRAGDPGYVATTTNPVLNRYQRSTPSPGVPPLRLDSSPGVSIDTLGACFRLASRLMSASATFVGTCGTKRDLVGNVIIGSLGTLCVS